jgi:hypothetical protein
MSAPSNRQPIEWENPRTVLEMRETPDAPITVPMEDVVAALSRFLLFMVGDGRTTLRLESVGLRTMAVLKKIRPDLVDGRSFESIASEADYGRSAAQNISSDFEELFNIRGVNDKSDEARSRFALAWEKHHAGDTPGPDCQLPLKLGLEANPVPVTIRNDEFVAPGYLTIVNRFAAWRRGVKIQSLSRKTRQQLKADLRPLADFLSELDT